MAMKRICDICGTATGDTAYQFSVPALLVNNDGRSQNPTDSSATDVCASCTTTKQTEIVANLKAKAQPAGG